MGNPVSVERDDTDMEAARIAARLEIVDALLWASEHAQELLAIVMSGPNGSESLRQLLAPPHGLTELQAHHVLDLQFRRLSPENVALLREEAIRLRRGEFTQTHWRP